METPKSFLEDQTSPHEKKEEKPKALPSEADSQEVASSLGELESALKTDKGITPHLIESLRSAIQKAKESARIEIGGELYPLKDLPPGLDIKEQQEICSQILAGNYDNSHNLKILPPKVAAAIAGFTGHNLNLYSLTSAEGLTLPQSVWGELWLQSLTSAQGLVLPQSVGGAVYLTSLPEEEKEALRKKYPRLFII